MFLEFLALFLLELLGHECFRTREMAQKALTGINNLFDVRLVVEGGLDHADPEVRRRAKQIKASYYAVAEYFPRFEFLNSDYDPAEHRSIAGKYDYAFVGWCTTNPAVAYKDDFMRRVAAREYIHGLLKKGVSRWTIVAHLEEALACERQIGRVPALPPPKEKDNPCPS